MDFSAIESSEQAVADTTQRVSSDNTMGLSMNEPAEPERLMLYRSIMQETSRKITSSIRYLTFFLLYYIFDSFLLIRVF